MEGNDTRTQLQRTIEAHFSAVGKVAAFWSEFERQLQMTVWKLAGIDAFSGACITSRIDSSAKLLEAIISLLQLKGVAAQDLEPLRAFCEEAADLQRERDRIVNDPWSFRIVDAFPHRKEVERYKNPGHDHVPHSTKEVDAFAERISDLLYKLQGILSTIPLLAPGSDSEFKSNIVA